MILALACTTLATMLIIYGVMSGDHGLCVLGFAIIAFVFHEVMFVD